MTEEELLKSRWSYIARCARKYMVETHTDQCLFDDVFQEAAIAYLLWHRKAEKLNDPDFWHYGATAIRYHLLKKLVDKHGVGVTYDNMKKLPHPTRLSLDDSIQMISDTDFDIVYLHDWISSLPPEYFEIAKARYITGGKPRNLKISRATYFRRLKSIRKSYDDYFNEAG